jgi:Na+-driven multidrug efflux pump
MIADAVDQQILTAFGLLAVLLVFIFAFAASLIPQFAVLLARDPGPEDDKKRVRREMTVLQCLFGANMLAAVAVFCVLLPLTSQVLGTLSDEKAFPTTKASMILADAFLLITIAAEATAIRILQTNKPST